MGIIKGCFGQVLEVPILKILLENGVLECNLDVLYYDLDQHYISYCFNDFDRTVHIQFDRSNKIIDLKIEINLSYNLKDYE